jgi:hypothetical protein
MAMTEGTTGDITTNDRRFTDREARQPGRAVAWRVKTSNDQIDTVVASASSSIRSVSTRTSGGRTWGGNRFNLQIKDGGANGDANLQLRQGLQVGSMTPTRTWRILAALADAPAPTAAPCPV